MKIFDTVIAPMLTYGSEVWGGGGGADHDGKLGKDPIALRTDEAKNVTPTETQTNIGHFC